MRWLIIALLVSWLNAGAADEINRAVPVINRPVPVINRMVPNQEFAGEAVDEIPDWKNYQAQNATRNAFDSIIKNIKESVVIQNGKPPVGVGRPFSFKPKWKEDEFANIPNEAFVGAVAAPNGRVVFVPHSSPVALVIDTNNGKVTTLNLPRGGDRMFSGGVLAPNGRLYFVPCYADYIGFIDTNFPIGQWRVTAIPIGLKDKWKWRGGVVARNEKIYFVPERADFIGVVNSVNNRFTGISHDFKDNDYMNGCLTPDGDVIFIPHHARQVAKLTVANVKVTKFGIAPGGAAYVGGVLGQDGMIYTVPNKQHHVLVIDPVKLQTRVLPLPFKINKDKWFGGALGPDGKIYCAPNELDTILVIEPDKAYEWADANGKPYRMRFPVRHAYMGVVLASDGRLYFSPYNAKHLLSIGIKQPLSENWVLSPLFNNF